MEIDSLKTQLGNLLALHRDDDANEDDIVFATVDYMKRAHDVAQMLLLEGRFQELQRCLHLCQAAFGDTANVRASIVGRSGSHAPLLSFVGASAFDAETGTAAAAGEETKLADQRASLAAIDGEMTMTIEEGDHGVAVQRYPFFVLHSEEDRRVFAALQSRTAQLQRQLEAAMRVRRGRDTEYYMQRLGLREKGTSLAAVTDDNARVHVQQLPAFQSGRTESRFRAESIFVSGPAAGTARASISPAAPPRPHRVSRQASVMAPTRTNSLFHVPAFTTTAAHSTTATSVRSATAASTVLVPVTSQPQLLMNSPGRVTVEPPTPPERGVSFGTQVHFSRGKGRIELPPLVTSGRLFGVTHDNPTSVQHTVFGSSATVAAATAAAAAAASRKGSVRLTAERKKNNDDNDDDDGGDFGIRAVEAMFGAEEDADAVPLHLRPVPEDVRLWSSSSSSASSEVLESAVSSTYAVDSMVTSMRVEKAPSPPLLSPETTLMDDPPLVSNVTPTAKEDDEDGMEGDLVASPRSRRQSSAFLSTLKSNLLSSTGQSVPSLMRRGTAVGPAAAAAAAAGAAGNGSDSAMLSTTSSHPQRRRTAPENRVASFSRSLPLSWQHLTKARKRSTDSSGMSATTNSAFAASASRTLVSIAESSSIGTTSTTTMTTTTSAVGTSASDQHGLLPAEPDASPAALEAARTVEAARQTTQYILSSMKAQHSRSSHALQRCDALTISRLPYAARHAALAQDEVADDRTTTATAAAVGTFPLTPRMAGEEWTPTSQPLTASSSSQAPSSPGTEAVLASPLQSAMSAGTLTATAASLVTPSAQNPWPLSATQLRSLSPAAEQQLRNVHAAYEQQLATAASDVRGLEARWVSQYRLLQTPSSAPQLENIAEWRKRRGRWQQQGHQHGSRHGTSRQRTRGPPPLPPPLAKSAAAGASPNTRASGRGSDTSFVAPPPPPPSTSAQAHSRSLSLISATPTRESRFSSYNAEEGGSAPSSRSSSSDAGVAAMLVTPVDRQALPLVGVHGAGGGIALASEVELSRYPSRGSPQTQPLPPAASPRVPSTPDEAPASPSPPLASTADAANGAVVDTVWLSDTSEQPIPGVGAARGHPPSSSANDSRDGSIRHDETSQVAHTPSVRSELGGELAETGVYAHHNGELVRGTVDSSLSGNSDGAAPRSRNEEMASVPFTYHPAVAAIIRERQREREAENASGGRDAGFSVPHVPPTTDDTLAAWQRTLSVVAGDAADNKAALDAAPRAMRTARWSSSMDTLAYPSETRPSVAYPCRPGPTRRSNTAVYPANPFVFPQTTVPVGDATLQRRHGIRCGAAAVRARRTAALLSDAIRDASSHVREEDLVRPPWQPGRRGPNSTSVTATSTATTAYTVPQPPRQPGHAPFLFDFPNVFAAAVTPVPATSDGSGDGGTAETGNAKNSVAVRGGVVSESVTRGGGGNHHRTTTGSATANGISEMSLLSVRSATTTTSTPALLSLTAKALTPPSTDPAATAAGSHCGPQPTAAAAILDTSERPSSGNTKPNHSLSGSSVRDVRSVASSSLEAATAAAHDAYQCLHTAYRVSEVLRAVPDWTVVAPSVLGRCLPLCTAAVRLQRWWRQRLACREQRRRQRRADAHVTHEQARDTAALRLQRQLRVHWARRVVAQHRAACALATEQRVAAENPPVPTAPARLNMSSSSGGYAALREALASASGAFTASTTSSHRTPHPRISGGGEPAVAYRAASQLGGPTMMTAVVAAVASPAPPVERGGRPSFPVASSSDTSLLVDDTPNHTLSAKDPWATTTTARRSLHQSDRRTTSSAKPQRTATATAVTVPVGVSSAAAALSRPLSFSSTSGDGDDDGAKSGHDMAVRAAAATARASPQTSPARTQNVSKKSSPPLDTQQAALRLQRWYRRCRATEAARLQREAALLAAVVTRRLPLTALREALRIPTQHRQGTVESDSEEGDKDEATSVVDDSAPRSALGDTGNLDDDVAADTVAMRALLAKCTGDVYQAFLRRAAVARQRGDYKTPLEHVSLRTLQRHRQDREDEAKQKRLLQERQQRLRQEQQQRRERQLIDAVKLLQRVGQGLRWRRWLRERQCRDLHYRATHTLDLLSQTDVLGTHPVVDGARRTAAAAARSRGGQSTVSEDEQRVRLSGGPKVTAHVMARLRATHPAWFGLNVDKSSAAWIAENASPAQVAAIVTVQSFMATFASRSVTFAQYQHACARSIQLAWRLHRQRKQRRWRKSHPANRSTMAHTM